MAKEKGLTKKEAETRLITYGLNEIKDVSKTTPFKILLRQIKNNFLIYLLAFATVLSFFVGKHVTAYVILVVIFMVIFAGFIQEYRAEKAISALKEMLVPITIVIRDGKEQEIHSLNIVPGDLLLLRNGEKIPADCIVMDEKELRVDESILTGESREVRKKKFSKQKYTEENLVFMGTHIVNGRCIAKVIHTGMNTKFGKIARLISKTEKELPLQQKVNKIAKYMVILAIIISVMTGAIMLLRSPAVNEELVINTLILVIALAVSAFPEGFPVVLMTTLASGAYHMAKQNAIVNRLSIIETLGETTVICSDKTGTITKGEMTVKKIFADSTFFEITGAGYEGKGDFMHNHTKIDINKKPILKMLLNSAVLCNDARIERTGQDMEYRAIGSPTESALLILGAKAGLFKEDLHFSRTHEMPFSSERKMMSAMFKINQEKIIYSKGAPEYIIKKCKFLQKNSGIHKMTQKDRNAILQANDKMTTRSLRTIALAYKKTDKFTKNNFEDNLIFIGIAGMEDPAREEVKESISTCLNAGIKVKMITGDNKETARAVAREIGLHGKIIEGVQLDTITDDELARIINSVSIFARVRPEHKLRIVKALKANGEIVTMTGDGVNDAPALKEAHIGIAMGKNGTDVSRSVADMTLKDDNFHTIVLAIREGRTIFKNIRKFATYQLSCNFSELAILFIGVLLAPVLGWQIPLLLALQILFMNLVTDNLPAISLGLNPASTDSMTEPPRKNSEILNRKLIVLLAFTGTLMTLLVLSSYYLVFNSMEKTPEYARTVALFSLIGLEIVAAFSFRSFRKGTLTRSPLVNPYPFYASLISLIATIAIVYTPLNRLFETVPLQLDGILIVLIISLIFIIITDILKYINRKTNFFDMEHI